MACYLKSTGHPVRARTRLLRHRMFGIQRGFTLIELLVVIVIIGVILSMATLSVGVLGRDTEIEDQSKRLYAVLTQAREEAELQGRDLGLLIEKDAYLFMRYDYTAARWQSLSNDELFVTRQLPDGLQFRLWLDSREVSLKTHQENQPLLARASSSSSSSSVVNSPSRTAPDDSVHPQIAILSSGDILPFELQIARDSGDFHWRILGAADNTLSIESGSTQ